MDGTVLACERGDESVRDGRRQAASAVPALSSENETIVINEKSFSKRNRGYVSAVQFKKTRKRY